MKNGNREILFLILMLFTTILFIPNAKCLEKRINFTGRMLQAAPTTVIANNINSVNTSVDFWGTKILYDTTNSKFVTITPMPNSLGKMSITWQAYNSNSLTNPTFVHENSCSLKSGGVALSYMPYNLAYVDTGSKYYAIFHNINTSVNIPDLNCGADNAALSLYTFNGSAFIKDALSMASVFTNTMITGINTLISNYCSACNFFQARATVYVKTSKILAGLFLFTNSADDLSPPPPAVAGKKVFVLLLCDFSAGLSCNNYFVFEDSYSSGMINVRNLYNIPNTNYIYFTLQENNQAFITTINLSDVSDPAKKKNPGTKLNLASDVNIGESNYGMIEYDSNSSQFILIYLSSIQFNIMRFNAVYFKLDTTNYNSIMVSLVNGVNQQQKISQVGALSYPLMAPPTNLNAVTMIKVMPGYGFILICDYYYCTSAKLMNSNLGYSRIFSSYTILPLVPSVGFYSKLSDVAYNNDTNNASDIVLWYAGTLYGNGTVRFLGNSGQSSANCLFYMNQDNSKCQTSCDTGLQPYDTTKSCVPTTCSSNYQKYFLNNYCSTHCGEYNAAVIFGNFYVCRNLPCPTGTLYKSYTNSINQNYHECATYCPTGLFYDQPTSTCSQSCPSNLYTVVNSSTALNQCVFSCPYADARFGTNSGPPYQCFTITGNVLDFRCPLGSLMVRSGNLNGALATMCVSSCPSGFYLDETGLTCLKCVSNSEGYVWNNICMTKCPAYTVPTVSTSPASSTCMNCKAIGYKWYNNACYSSVPTTTVLVDETFAAYKNCQEVGKKVYNNACVDDCPLGTWPHSITDYICYNPTNDKKYIFNNTTVDICPISYGPDEARRCVKCYSVGYGQYEYNRNCVSACPWNYYWNKDNVCIACNVNGNFTDPIYKANCVVPTCPSNAYTDYTTRKCIYCKDSNQFMLNGACVDTCPSNSVIDFDKYECTYCRQNDNNYYYKNECYSECPIGTIPTEYFTCMENLKVLGNDICKELKPCMYGRCENVSYGDKFKCTCDNSTIVGKYCNLQNNYVQNFYNSHKSYISSLKTNYTRFSNINKVIIEIDSEVLKKILANLDYIQENLPDIETNFVDLANNFLDMSIIYISVIQKALIKPNYELYRIYDNLFKIARKNIESISMSSSTINSNLNSTMIGAVNNSQLNSTNMNKRILSETNSNVQSIISIIDKIQLHVIKLSNSFTYVLAASSDLTTKKLNFKYFNLDFYYTSSMDALYEYTIKSNHSVIEFPDCEASLKSLYKVSYFPGSSIIWSDEILINKGLYVTNADAKSMSSVNIALYNPSTFTQLDFVKDCSSSDTSPINIFFRHKMPFKGYINKTLSDYYFSKNVNIYDSSSKFFNDRCYVYVSDDEYDVTLQYRKRFLSPNITIDCGTSCIYIGIDLNENIICQCDYSKTPRTSLDQAFNIYTLPISFTSLSGNNLQLLSCGKLVLSNTENYTIKNAKIIITENVGFWIGIGFPVLTLFLITIMSRISGLLFDYNISNYVYYDALYHTNHFSPFKISLPDNKQIQNKNVGDANSFPKNSDKNEIQGNNSCNIELATIKPESAKEINDEDKEKMLALNNFVDVDSLYRRKNEKMEIPAITQERKLNEYDPLFNINLTYEELTSLKAGEVIKNDHRNCLRYYYDWLVNYNYFFNAFFMKSLIYPINIRILILLLNINIQFTMNAMLFSDDYIDQIYINKIKYGFSFVFSNQLEKCVFSIIIARIPIILLRFLYIPSDRKRKNFNEYLISKNKGYIAKGL
jgi:hypothetical protein